MTIEAKIVLDESNAAFESPSNERDRLLDEALEFIEETVRGPAAHQQPYCPSWGASKPLVDRNGNTVGEVKLFPYHNEQ